MQICAAGQGNKSFDDVARNHLRLRSSGPTTRLREFKRREFTLRKSYGSVDIPIRLNAGTGRPSAFREVRVNIKGALVMGLPLIASIRPSTARIDIHRSGDP